MTRKVSVTGFLQRRCALCAPLLLLGVACHEDGTLYGVNGAAARVSISASASAIGEIVVVDLAYLRVDRASVPISTQSLTIASATTQQLTIPIDLTSCLLDATRVIPRDNACSVVGALTLRSASGAMLDSSLVGPVSVSVGAVENLPATTLRAIGVVGVTAPVAMLIGATASATAVVRDREGAIIAGRPVTWSSSSPAVLTVNTVGALTAVSAGSATITAQSQGVSGTAIVTVSPRMTILSVTPTASETNVLIEASVRVTFSENIDALTVNASTIRLTQNGVDMPAARNTTANVVQLTPSALLTEFSSPYVLTVSTALASVAGNRLAINNTSPFTTVFWDPGYSYRLTNELRGPGESLDVLTNATTCFMVTTSNASSQFWYFVPIGTTGFSTMANVVSGDTKGLEGAIAPTRCFMFGPPFTHGQFSGTFWKAVSAAPFSPGRYYMQNANFGAARSLDISPDTTGAFAPRMLPTGNVIGQFWSITRLGRL